MHHGQSPIRRPQAVAGFGTAVGGRHGERPARDLARRYSVPLSDYLARLKAETW